VTAQRGERGPASQPVPARGRGRPPIGERVEVRLPADMLAAIDQHAASNSMTRAEAIRDLLTKTVKAPAVQEGRPR